MTQRNPPPPVAHYQLAQFTKMRQGQPANQLGKQAGLALRSSYGRRQQARASQNGMPAGLVAAPGSKAAKAQAPSVMSGQKAFQKDMQAIRKQQAAKASASNAQMKANQLAPGMNVFGGASTGKNYGPPVPIGPTGAPVAPTPGPVPAPAQMPQAAVQPGQASGNKAQQALNTAVKAAKPAAGVSPQLQADIQKNLYSHKLAQAQAKTAAAYHLQEAGIAAHTRQSLRLKESQAYVRQQKARRVTHIALDISSSMQGLANGLSSRLAALPTPGGIFLMVIIVVFFLWAVVPVNNGLTRAQLFYLTLTGKTELNPWMELGSMGGPVGSFFTQSFSSFGASPGSENLAQTVAGTGPNSGSSGQPQQTQNLNFDFAPNIGPQYM